MNCWEEAWYLGAVTTKCRRRIQPIPISATVMEMNEAVRRLERWIFGIH